MARRAHHRILRPRGRRDRAPGAAVPRGRVPAVDGAARVGQAEPLGWPRRPRHPRDGAARRGEPLLLARLVPPARRPTPVRARTTRTPRRRRGPGPSGPAGELHGPPAGARAVPARTPDGRRDGSVRTQPAPVARRRARRAVRDPGDRRPRARARHGERSDGRLEPVPSAAADRRGLLHDACLPRGRRPAAYPLAVRGAHGRADDPPERSDETRDRPDLPRQPGRRDRPHAHRTVRTRGLLCGERRRAAPSQRVRPAAQHAGRPAGGHVRRPLHGCADDDGDTAPPGRSRPPSPISGPGPPRTRR